MMSCIIPNSILVRVVFGTISSLISWWTRGYRGVPSRDALLMRAAMCNGLHEEKGMFNW